MAEQLTRMHRAALQFERIRESGSINMIDRIGVQQIAQDSAFLELEELSRDEYHQLLTDYAGLLEQAQAIEAAQDEERALNPTFDTLLITLLTIEGRRDHIRQLLEQVQEEVTQMEALLYKARAATESLQHKHE